MIQQQKKALALEETKRAEMHLMEEEKYRKQREDKHQKMKEELMLLKLEAENLKYENRVKAAKENEKYTEEELTEKFHMKCK